MLSSLFCLLILATVAVVAFGLGWPLLHWANLGEDDPLTLTVHSIGLGLVGVGLLLMTLAFVGGLYGPALILLTVVGGCWGMFQIACATMVASHRASHSVREISFDELVALTQRGWRPPQWLVFGMTVFAGTVLFSMLVTDMAPPTSSDALGMRLEWSKSLLREHGMFGASAVHSLAALSLFDLWHVWALALDGETCVHVLQWGLGLLLVLSIVSLASPFVGRPWAWLAGALALATPGVQHTMTTFPPALALAVCGVLALDAWWRTTIHGQHERWLAVAGLMLGGAFAVHGTAACLIFAVVGAAWFWTLGRHVEQRQFLLRAAAKTIFPAVGIGIVYQLAWTLAAPTSSAALKPSTHGTAWDVLGMVLVAAIPGLFLARRLRGMGEVRAVAVGGVVIGGVLRSECVLICAIPCACIAAVWAWNEMWRFPRPALRVLAAAFAVMIVAAGIAPLVRSRSALRVAVGFEDRESYLLRCEPTYRAAAVANAILPPDAHILSQADCVLYFNRRVTRESFAALSAERFVPDDVLQHWLEAGFTHRLLTDSVVSPIDKAVPDLCQRETLLDSYFFRDADGRLRRYQLIMLR